MIISTKNAWYFDHGFWGRTPFYQWSSVYENRLPQHPGVLGGEACVWSELIDTTNLGGAEKISILENDMDLKILHFPFY